MFGIAMPTFCPNLPKGSCVGAPEYFAHQICALGGEREMRGHRNETWPARLLECHHAPRSEPFGLSTGRRAGISHEHEDEPTHYGVEGTVNPRITEIRCGMAQARKVPHGRAFARLRKGRFIAVHPDDRCSGSNTCWPGASPASRKARRVQEASISACRINRSCSKSALPST